MRSWFPGAGVAAEGATPTALPSLLSLTVMLVSWADAGDGEREGDGGRAADGSVSCARLSFLAECCCCCCAGFSGLLFGACGRDGNGIPRAGRDNDLRRVL